MTRTSFAKNKNRTISVAGETPGAGISTGAAAAFGTIAALIGLWAVACFAGALLAAGGPLALAKAWISAVTGG